MKKPKRTNTSECDRQYAQIAVAQALARERNEQKIKQSQRAQCSNLIYRKYLISRFTLLFFVITASSLLATHISLLFTVKFSWLTQLLMNMIAQLTKRLNFSQRQIYKHKFVYELNKKKLFSSFRLCLLVGILCSSFCQHTCLPFMTHDQRYNNNVV